MTVAATAASMAAASSQASAQKKNAEKAAHDANDAAFKQSSAEYRNQEATMRWQDDNWQQDLDFATQTLGYQGAEFAKQGVYVAAAGEAIIKNEDAELAQAALKSVQQNVAITLGEANVNTKAAEGRASAQVAADARGVQGHSVDAIIDDVSRQQGQAISVMEMNRSAMAFQARTDMDAVKAAGDTQLGQLQASIKTYQPSTPIRTPQPVGTVQSPTLVSAPAQADPTFGIIATGLQTGLSVFNTANSLSGSTASQTLGGVGKALGIG